MANLLDLTDRTILVTGASSGIGRQTAVTLADLGARIVLVGRSEERLQTTAARLVGEGHRVEPFDLNDVEAIPKWMKGLAKETGPLNGMVHSAGIMLVKPLRYTTPADYTDVMTINVIAAAALLRGFRQKGVVGQPASAVLMASVMGLVGQPGLTAYATSKGALCSLTRSAAVEMADEQIRVNCIAPGWVETELTERAASTLTPEQLEAIRDQHPLGFGQPTDVANTVAFLVSDASRWMTGSTLAIDGGYTAH